MLTGGSKSPWSHTQLALYKYQCLDRRMIGDGDNWLYESTRASEKASSLRTCLCKNITRGNNTVWLLCVNSSVGLGKVLLCPVANCHIQMVPKRLKKTTTTTATKNPACTLLSLDSCLKVLLSLCYRIFQLTLKSDTLTQEDSQSNSIRSLFYKNIFSTGYAQSLANMACYLPQKRI